MTVLGIKCPFFERPELLVCMEVINVTVVSLLINRSTVLNGIDIFQVIKKV